MHPAHLISNGDGVIWFNDVKCSGSESKLQNCSFNNNIQQCNHHDDVGVHCFLSCSAEDEGMNFVNIRIVCPAITSFVTYVLLLALHMYTNYK